MFLTMELDDVQNEIIIESADEGSMFFHAVDDPESKFEPGNVKSEIDDDILYVYFGNKAKDAPTEHNYDKDQISIIKWNNIRIKTNEKTKKVLSSVRGDLDEGESSEGVVTVASNEEINVEECSEKGEELNVDDPCLYRLFCCKICGRKYKHAYLLKSHVRIHFQEKKYVCNICQKSFAISTHLKNHYSVHTGEKKYQCTMCEKSFKQKGHLFNHTKTHTGDKSYECQYCQKKFTQNIHMKSHLKIHTGEKGYSCRICGKQFKQSGHLQMHMAVHTGERRYECEFCDMRFKQSGHLISHRKIHMRNRADGDQDS